MKQVMLNNLDINNVLQGSRSLYEIIPLGTTCTISHYLRGRGLRTKAFPFDWNVTPIQSAIELVKNRFSDFLVTDNLIILPPSFRLLFDESGVELEMKNDIITPVVCKKYNILFPHDFPKNYKDSLESVRAKYSKRIERLTKLMSSNKHLIFVHHNEDINEWQKNQYMAALNKTFTNNDQRWKSDLSVILDENYPNLSYSLVDLHSLASIIDSVRR